MRRVAVIGVVVLAAAAGCGGSAGSAARPAASCVQALDAADQAFTDLAGNIRVVQQALDEAMSGDVSSANVTLDGVGRVSAVRYKQLEGECRSASK